MEIRGEYSIRDFNLDLNLKSYIKERDEDIIILPLNKEKNLIQEIEKDKFLFGKYSSSLVKVLKNNSVSASLLIGDSEKICYLENRSVDLIVSSILISNYLIENPDLFKVCLEKMINYLKIIFENKPSTISAEIVFENKKSESEYKSFSFKGELPKDFKTEDLIKIIKETNK